MFVTNWISTTKIQKISEITNFFRHYFLSRTEVVILKSENKHLAPLRFGEDIDVQSLSDDNEHLRAYYYPDGEQPMLFTPFLLPDAQYLFNAILIN